MTAQAPKTLFDKIWDAHVVTQPPGSPAVLYIDLHLVHEVTSPQAFADLRVRGLKVRRPERTAATIDHAVPTRTTGGPLGRLSYADDQNREQIRAIEQNCQDFGIRLFGLEDDRQGIVHVIGPEQGLTQPGMTIVCGDSHTATHGALGALAFGIGTSEVEYVLATQCLLQRRPKTLEVRLDGQLARGVTAKDIILALIGQIGVGGGTGCAIEYTGSAAAALSMEERMTICNMTIEGGARTGMFAPDEKTYQYMAGRAFAPKGADWDSALARWRQLPGDPGAAYDRSLTLDASKLVPVITFGTNPGMVIPVGGNIPQLSEMADASSRSALEKSLRYMNLTPGETIAGHPVNVVFIGSCTNGRIYDLRQAAGLLKGRKVAAGVRALVVPGSQEVKRLAEAEGLDKIFLAAGAEWREPGCSMCLAMNGDQVGAGQYAVSTSNRNFEGRQGPGSRTFLASPLTAAASAVTGQVTDPRPFLT